MLSSIITALYFFTCVISVVECKLSPLNDSKILFSQDIGTYHTDVFEHLGELYSQQKPRKKIDVIMDISSILKSYCPEDDEECKSKAYKATMVEFNHVREGHWTDFFFSANADDRITNSMNATISSIQAINELNLDDILHRLTEIQDEIEDMTEVNAFHRSFTLASLSIVIESTKLWHAIYFDIDHPLHDMIDYFLPNSTRRRVQQNDLSSLIETSINRFLLEVNDNPKLSSSPIILYPVIGATGAAFFHGMNEKSIECPKDGDDPITLNPNSIIDISISSLDKLCTIILKKVSVQGEVQSIKPVARSYDGNDWEAVKGPYNSKFVCKRNSCIVTIPEIPSEMHSFQLISYSSAQVNLSIEDKASRFLEQSTFGPTIESVSFLANSASNDQELDENIAKWIDDQINSQPVTSHREYFRKRSNTRVFSTDNVGSPLHPCAPQTRWRSHAFTEIDQGLYIHVSKTSDDSAYLLSIDSIPRTEVTDVEVNRVGDLAVGESYRICGIDTKSMKLRVKVGNICQDLLVGIPPIQFTSKHPSTPFNTIKLPPDKLDDFSPLAGSLGTNDFFLKNGLESSTCDSINVGTYPVYLDFLDGNWLAFDPRVILLDNSLDHVISDGGASAEHLGAKCANVPRTFVNFDSCKLSTEIEACQATVDFPNVEIPLSTESINNLNELTGDFVYAVSGLRPEVSPCKHNERSRWLVVDTSQCSQNENIDTNTKNTLIGLLQNVEGSSLRDIIYKEGSCNRKSTTPSPDINIYIQIDSTCWKLVHPDYYNVYDMTPWIFMHPGGPHKITEFAAKKEAFLEFPDWHEMWRWDDNKHLFPLLGRLGDSVFYHDLPLSLKLESVAEQYSIQDEEYSGSGVLVCGSPGEIANDHSLGETGYSMRLVRHQDNFPLSYLETQKQKVWTMVTLEAKDQLRQRMAWALSQIFAISPSCIEDHHQSELYFVYYDIFVRNAFGNYRDILKEVAYSYVMAQMLTYYESKSAAYNWDRFRTVNFADENFAREIMQLFTIGTVMLNIDGITITSPITNAPILTYTNDHIMSFARAWTGFKAQRVRGNIEIYRFLVNPSTNAIDPMHIKPEWRDVFPKINLQGGYVGDGYPLCVDLPDRHFLRKGAKYRLLGSSATLELQSNPYSIIDSSAKSLSLTTSSKLYNKLCNPKTYKGHDCRWQNEVILDDNIFCEGRECVVDTLRLVKVTDSVFFEYLHPPCVRLPYYNDAKKVSTAMNKNMMCADPKSIVASEACCKPNRKIARKRNCEYVGERMTFTRAAERCEDIGQQICMFDELMDCNSLCCSWVDNYFWHDTDCQIQVKVDDSGFTALVHKPQNAGNRVVKSSFQSDSINYFPVHWVGDFPSSSNNCGNGLCISFNGDCLCNTQVVESMVFNSIPESATEILSELHIGSFKPDTSDLGLYGLPIERNDMKVYLRKTSSFDVNTIFEIEVHQTKRYFKNVRSMVVIVDDVGQETQFSFRNPPHFMNMVEPEALDAHYETDAVLDDYFYHPNTAPFLATYFIQRFGISNPSPRYVKNVATAFKNGSYGSNFGNGRYGDLEAMIAAVLLDREARSTVVGFDPSAGSLREPLLKLIGFMRSMKFTTFPEHPEITFREDMSSQIGQMAHEIPSVFSFFEQDYQTVGSVQDASLVSPEGQRYDTTTIFGLLNGLFSMAKYGLTSCYDGFGKYIDSHQDCHDNDGGQLSYIPTDPNNVDSVVDELAMVLTAGRLNQESRKTIKEQYIRSVDSESGLRLAQQLIVSSPEFHSTNFIEFNGQSRKAPEPSKPSTKPYKALTYLMLIGGVDSYNILVPHSGCKEKDMYSEYQSVRAQAALSKQDLLEIKTGKNEQICDTFGIHKDLPILKSLYDDGDALFFSNTGVLFEPVTKKTWDSKTLTQLFAHNTQQRDTQQVDAYQEVRGTGILGRMADILTSKGYNTGSFATSDHKTSLIGEPLKSPSIFTLREGGALNSEYSAKNITSAIADINNKTKLEFGLFGTTWSELLNQALFQSNQIQNPTDSIEMEEAFPDTNIGQQLLHVSKSIRARESLDMDRQFFMTAMKGFDSHKNVFGTLDKLLPKLNDALSSFVNEMKAIGEWENVALIMTSDFGRSLTPNSGDGTDHGWGGNYFVIGGGLDGGRILGEYPHDLTSKSPVMLSRGRVIPTTSWDSIMNGIAQWIGIESNDELDELLPNRGNFINDLFEKSDIFLAN